MENVVIDPANLEKMKKELLCGSHRNTAPNLRI
jgi:hypothetical protein